MPSEKSTAVTRAPHSASQRACRPVPQPRSRTSCPMGSPTAARTTGPSSAWSGLASWSYTAAHRSYPARTPATASPILLPRRLPRVLVEELEDLRQVLGGDGDVVPALHLDVLVLHLQLLHLLRPPPGPGHRHQLVLVALHQDHRQVLDLLHVL